MKIEINELMILNKIIIQKLKGIYNRVKYISENNSDTQLLETLHELITIHEDQEKKYISTILHP